MKATGTKHESATFQWNGAGWLGAAFGTTAWMVVTAGFLIAYRQPMLAALPITCFLLTNGVAFLLWKRQDRLEAFSALMYLLGIVSIALPAVWISTTLYGSAEVLAAMNWPTSHWFFIPVALAAPSLAFCFYLSQRSRQPI